MGETTYWDNGPVDAAWLCGAMEHLGLDSAAAARLLDMEPDDLRAMLTGDQPVEQSLREVLEAVFRFTARVTDQIAERPSVLVYRDDLAFMRALPEYADYCAAWYQLAAVRARVINPDLQITFDRPPVRQPLSA